VFMREIETKPAEQPTGEILNKAQGCSKSCFTAPQSGMILEECPHYSVKFHINNKLIQEFCDNDEATKQNIEM